MPTENEAKFCLTIESQDAIAEASSNQLFMRQGYLAFTKGMSVRIRSEQPYSENLDFDVAKYKLCMKQKANGRVIEIEKKIDQRDFDDLWSISMNRLEKIRYIVDRPGGIWEVDYFQDHGETYFALAEHEMPECQKEPTKIPGIIKKYLLYAVPMDDENFSSKRLACLKHAKKMYSDLTKVVV